MSNTYTDSSAISVHITAINNTASDLETNLDTCQIGIETDTGLLAHKDADGTYQRNAPRSELTEGTIPKCADDTTGELEDSLISESGTTVTINGLLSVIPSYTFDTYSAATYTQDATKSCCVCTAVVDSALTLPATSGSGKIYHYVNYGTGIITLTPASGTIMGSATQVLNPNESIDLIDYAAGVWIW